MALHRRVLAVLTRAGSESGATAVEYALIAALIAAFIGLTVSLLGQEVLAMFESVDF